MNEGIWWPSLTRQLDEIPRQASTDFASFCVTSAYFAPLLTVLVVAQTVWVEGEAVLDKKIDLATFLSSLAALRTVRM